MAYVLDESEEERAKGKTVETGRAYFETESKTYPSAARAAPHRVH